MQIPNPMTNRPIFRVMNAFRNGNPFQILQQAAGRNPYAAQTLQAIQGKGPEQMRQTAENMAKERGISLEQLAGQFGLTLPK